MARARNIKPGFYKNEDLAECSIWARFIFPGLWMLADREGRLEDRPKRIKGELIPFDAQDVEPLLRELAARGFIHRYQIDGASYIQISKFKGHQSPHYSEKASAIKGPELPEKVVHIDAKDSGSKPPINNGENGRTPFLTPPDCLNPDSPNPDSPKKADAPQRSRGSRLQPDWEPDPTLQAWASKERPDLDLDAVIEGFRDFWIAKPGKDGTKLDWPATFRNWVRNQRSAKPGFPQAGSAPRPTIQCRSCGNRVSTWTGHQCDPCWRKSQGMDNPLAGLQ